MVGLTQNPKIKPPASLVLGTVQFGASYGIANHMGKPDIGRVREILDIAHSLGIRMLDTAAAYGDSEAVLGACGMDRWSVITKLPSFEGIGDTDIGPNAHKTVMRSLDRLGVETLNGVLAHDRRDMIGVRGCRLREALEPLVESGRIGAIGVSVYSPQDMAGVDAVNAQIVQAPFSVLDQRFIVSGEGAKLRTRGAELHVRSVFLQGLLLMPAHERPARFAPWAQEIDRYDTMVRDSRLSPTAFCLGFAARQKDVARCVVGVDTPQQISELVESFEVGQKAAPNAQNLASNVRELIDPRHWKDVI